MMKRNKIAIILCCIAFLAAQPATVYATNAEDVDTISAEAESEDGAEDETEESEEEVSGVAGILSTLSPEAVDEAITSIDATAPVMEDVIAIREAYDSLSMAAKVRVENYNQLVQAEKTLGIENEADINSNDVDNGGQKNGTTFTFEMTEYVPSTTVNISYVTDEDSDGKMDAPKVKLISPTNQVYEIFTNDTSLENDECNIAIVRTDTDLRLDIANASKGNWTIETSNRVIFVASEYQGDNPTSNFNSEAAQDTNEEKTETKKGTNPIILLVFVVVVIGIFIGIKKMPTGKKDQKKNKKAAADNGEENVRVLTPEEEIQKIKEEWEREKEQGLYDNILSESKTDEEVDEDDRLYQTVEEFGDENDIEDLDDGFFTSGSRFSK